MFGFAENLRTESGLAVALFCAGLATVSCGSEPSVIGPAESLGLPALSCAPSREVVDVGGRGIPALFDPEFVPVDDPKARYLDDYARTAGGDPESPEARVIGLEVEGTAIAIPHNVLWWHEIVNTEIGGRRFAITYCPLTGSALVFDVTAQSSFGVSGLVYRNNLVMFDVETESLWPQMCTSAHFGPQTGIQLVHVPAIEMRWLEWKERHPNSLVVGDKTGHSRDYHRYPYGDYESNDALLFAMPGVPDPRLRMKERVLGIPGEPAGVAFPLKELARNGSLTVVETQADGNDLIVLWDGDAQAAAAYFPRTTTGTSVTLQVIGSSFIDDGGTTWDVEGRALTGPMAGESLEPYASAYPVFWFAWAAFYPRTSVWRAG